MDITAKVGQHYPIRILLAGIAICSMITSVFSFPILKEGDLKLDGNVEIGMGVFNSLQDYSPPD